MVSARRWSGSQVRYSDDYGTMVVEAGPYGNYLRILVDCRRRHSVDSYTIALPSNSSSATLAQLDLALIDEEPAFDNSDDAPGAPVPDP